METGWRRCGGHLLLGSGTGLQPAGRIAPGPHGRKENYPGSLPLAAVVFGVFFLIATWPLHSGRVTAGAVLTGLLWL